MLNRKYKDYVYRKMLVQEYLNDILRATQTNFVIRFAKPMPYIWNVF